ncbi:hypothetical protein CN330_27535 [Priestia megaterium]|uniref:hypothetical protein n=1 Tax=Priestia megaterium TaxID=1404 RepID=UPI000BF2FC41|nr:hypothetical protein [Priestia megaterium]PEZ06124.1 hypothetical protein CN330_27535 [Priestia megaterium]
MKTIEEKVKIYNKIKIDLIKVSQCLEFCAENDKTFYQDIALNYSNQLKSIKEAIEKTYNVEICECNLFTSDRKKSL